MVGLTARDLELEIETRRRLAGKSEDLASFQDQTGTMSEPTPGRVHSKKAGIRAAVILIGLLHKSRRAKEREREKERETEREKEREQ